jgi:hypothetical protein
MIIFGLNLPLAEIIAVLHVLMIIMLYKILKRIR